MLQTQFNFNSLMIQNEVGEYRPASSKEVMDAALDEVRRRFTRGEALTSPDDARRHLQLRLAPLEHEVFAVLWLDLCGAETYVQ